MPFPFPVSVAVLLPITRLRYSYSLGWPNTAKAAAGLNSKENGKDSPIRIKAEVKPVGMGVYVGLRVTLAPSSEVLLL